MVREAPSKNISSVKIKCFRFLMTSRTSTLAELAGNHRYGHKRLGMNYERAEFGMKISDAQVRMRASS